jgi:predicted RNA-binding protein with PUA-like domain
MSYWLMKSEPNTFSIDDLEKAPNQTTAWEGVRNYQARNMMRDKMKLGDLAFYYHSNCEVPGIVGIVKISKTAYPDHSAFDPSSHYYDPKSTSNNPRWWMVNVTLEQKFKEIIPLSILKTIPALQDMALVRKGNRLSVMPVSKIEWNAIMNMREQK